MDLPTSLTIASLLLLGFFAQWLAWRVRLPAILFLLLIGLLLGPVFDVLNPSEAMGDLLFPLVSLAVAVILFEGSMTLRFEELSGVGAVIRNLVTVGVAVTWAGLALSAHYLVGLPWDLALLFGAIGSVTGPTVIMPMLRSLRPNAAVSNVLRWEGIIIDPVGALLAVLVFEAIVSGQEADPVIVFGELVLTGTVLGAIGAGLFSILLKRHWLPEYLLNYGALAWMLVIYTTSNAIMEESGLLAVTVMGILLANVKSVYIESILDFKEDLSVLLISMLFIVLAARVDFDTLMGVIWPALGVLAIAKLIIRPLAVWISTMRSGLTRGDRALLAWIAPRGIVAAAVASLFALRLSESGETQAELIVPLIFMLIIGTVVIESATGSWLARRLGVSASGPRGLFVVGANRVSLAITQALLDQGKQVLIADTDAEGLRQARMMGAQTYYGNPLSEHADRHLELTNYGTLLAMSLRAEMNTLVCTRFRPEFGASRVYALQISKDGGKRSSSALALPLQALTLFADDVTWSQLAGLLAKGGRIRSTPLTREYSYENYLSKRGETIIPLFAFDEDDVLRVASAREPLKPEPGWTVMSLVYSPDEPSKAEKKRAARDDQAAARPTDSAADNAPPADTGDGSTPGSPSPAAGT